MRKLILILFLFVAGIAKSQTYQADTLVYFSNLYNEKPDTTLVEPIRIIINSGYILITKHDARFKAKILDTLPIDRVSDRIRSEYFTIEKAIEDTSYHLMLILSYFDNFLVSVGISHDYQLFIYHIENQLISTYLKPKEWNTLHP